MKPKLNATAKAKAKKAGKAKGVAYKKAKDAKKVKDAKMTPAEKKAAKEASAVKKDAWKAKKKKKFKGKMTLTGIDFTKKDNATMRAKTAFEDATKSELALTEGRYHVHVRDEGCASPFAGGGDHGLVRNYGR